MRGCGSPPVSCSHRAGPGGWRAHSQRGSAWLCQYTTNESEIQPRASGDLGTTGGSALINHLPPRKSVLLTGSLRGSPLGITCCLHQGWGVSGQG